MKLLRVYVLTLIMLALLVSLSVAGAKDRNAVRTLSVEMLTKSPEKFTGKDVTVQAVVATVSAEKKIFTIVDAAACGGCPSKRACATPEIQVEFKGDLPSTKKVVKITGRLVEQEKGAYVLQASKVN